MRLAVGVFFFFWRRVVLALAFEPLPWRGRRAGEVVEEGCACHRACGGCGAVAGAMVRAHAPLASEVATSRFLAQRRAERAAEAARAAAEAARAEEEDARAAAERDAAATARTFSVTAARAGAGAAAEGESKPRPRELTVSVDGIRCEGGGARGWFVPSAEVYRADASDSGRALALTVLKTITYECASPQEADELVRSVKQWGMGKRELVDADTLGGELTTLAAIEAGVRPLRERRAALAAQVRALQAELLGDDVKLTDTSPVT